MIDSKSGMRMIAVAGATLTVLALAGCGSSGPSGSSSAPTGTATTAGTPASTATPAPTSTGAASSADAATSAAITNAYEKFFAPSTPLQTSVGLLQNGSAFTSALEQQGSSSFAKQASASVSDISLLSADTAKLSYTISLGGTPTLKDQTGYAVREDGTWKVADYTFCQLMTLQGGAPAACKTPAATTVPK